MAVTNAELARALSELIEALDRRVPRVDQAGEASIARDARTLRARAVTRLTEIDRQHITEPDAPLAKACCGGDK